MDLLPIFLWLFRVGPWEFDLSFGYGFASNFPSVLFRVGDRIRCARVLASNDLAASVLSVSVALHACKKRVSAAV